MVGCNCFFNLTRIIIPSRCCFILFFSDFCSLIHNFVPSCYYTREILLLHGLKIRRYLKGIMLMMIVLFLIWYLCKKYIIIMYMHLLKISFELLLKIIINVKLFMPIFSTSNLYGFYIDIIFPLTWYYENMKNTSNV